MKQKNWHGQRCCNHFEFELFGEQTIDNNPAPPPHIALNENATKAQMNNMIVEVSIENIFF